MTTPHVIAALLAVTLCNAQVIPPTGFALRSSEQSPNGDILVQTYERHEADGTHVVQIWLASAEHSDDATMLFEHRRAAELVFSPDESRIAINHHASSTDGVIEVFERVSGVRYKEVVPAGAVRAKALASFLASAGRGGPKEFDHLYADCLLWSADSSAFLVRLHGHMSGVATLRDYCCIFRVSEQSISLDLVGFDRHSLLERHQ